MRMARWKTIFTEVERTMRGIRRAKGMVPNDKAPLLPAQLVVGD